MSVGTTRRSVLRRATPCSGRPPAATLAVMTVTMVISGGTVFDGLGGPGVPADVLVDGDTIVEVGRAPEWHDGRIIDATGLAVVPGFVNVLSHAWADLQRDGSATSELMQGVTTEVFGESLSPGPMGAEFASALAQAYGDLARTDFGRLGDGLDLLAGNGVVPNVASFVGGENLRTMAAGFADRPLTPGELDRIRGVLDDEMSDGALGLGTALIYPPGRYADTDELVALSEVVAAHDGLYISHLRSEGDAFGPALDELLAIGERAAVRTEVYHLKAAGRRNWPKMAQAIERIQAARAAGKPVSANMYPYDAGGTALAACIPPWFHDGGPAALAARLGDPVQRATIAAEIRDTSDGFENLFQATGGGSGILLVKDLPEVDPAAVSGTSTRVRGRYLEDVAADLGLDPADALVEIVRRDPLMAAAYFFIDEANIELGLAQPWVSIGSDASAHPASPPWSEEAAHPRSYGTFARVLGHYCRDRGVLTFPEAIRRMTSMPAGTFRLTGRGRLSAGSFADIVVLDPATVADRSTWEDPHRYAVGVRDVLVNGELALLDGRITGELPGRRLRRGQR
jgi:N-acyl-D-amino-acid deacylase